MSEGFPQYRPIESGRGLPHSTTLARLLTPPAISDRFWSAPALRRFASSWKLTLGKRLTKAWCLLVFLPLPLFSESSKSDHDSPAFVLRDFFQPTQRQALGLPVVPPPFNPAWTAQETGKQLPGVVPSPAAAAPHTNPAARPPYLLVLTNVPRLHATQGLAPGLYSASPYSMLVLVPGRTDSAMIKPLPQFEPRPGEIVEPPLRLTPFTRPRALPPLKTLREPTK